jgi:hypothetical protein
VDNKEPDFVGGNDLQKSSFNISFVGYSLIIEINFRCASKKSLSIRKVDANGRLLSLLAV